LQRYSAIGSARSMWSRHQDFTREFALIPGEVA
jgi:hypothetical protein